MGVITVTDTTDLTAELLEIERALWDANVAGDADFYDRMLRDDAVAVSPWGTLDKASAVALVRENRNPYTGYRLSDPVTVPLGEGAALITYTAEVDGINEGRPFTHTVYATSAYVREGQSWRSAFHQQSLKA